MIKHKESSEMTMQVPKGLSIFRPTNSTILFTMQGSPDELRHELRHLADRIIAEAAAE
jgi:hypothetical protein